MFKDVYSDDDDDTLTLKEHKFQGVGNYGEVDVTLVREDVLAFYTLRTFTLQVIQNIFQTRRTFTSLISK